ncbi:hypothetical protein BH20ACI1_BH20ACI1_16930 [soil metagenome]
MGKISLGVIVGFIVWTIIFVGGESVIRAISPSLAAPENATFVDSTALLIGYLIRSIIASVLAGLTAAFIARENSRTPLILGIVLLVVGLSVQIGSWNLLPIWYHLTFLILLIPMTLLGGKLKTL